MSEKIRLQGTKQELMELIPQILAFRQLIAEKDIGNIYGIPVTTFQDKFEFYPQVKLFFSQTRGEAGDKPAATGEITFRLMNETEKTINEAKAKVIAEKIKNKFAKPRPFVWRKGKRIATYMDQKKGYRFRLYVVDETEARRIIENVLDIRGQPPNWDKFSISESKKSFPEIPDRELIYGATRRLPRRRPREDIKFRYAELHVWGVPQAITLVDAVGSRPDPLILAT